MPPALRHRNVQTFILQTLERFRGLTPQAMSLSRLPASPYGLRRDKSALGRVPNSRTPVRRARKICPDLSLAVFHNGPLRRIRIPRTGAQSGTEIAMS